MSTSTMSQEVLQFEADFRDLSKTLYEMYGDDLIECKLVCFREVETGVRHPVTCTISRNSEN